MPLGSAASELSWTLLRSADGGAAGIVGGKPAPASAGLGSSDSSDREKRNLPDRRCRVCDAESERKSKYCVTHKRSYECIYRAAAKDRSSKEYEQFCSIFGGKIGDKTFEYQETQAAAVLIDFTQKFPSGKDSKKRGSIDLTQFCRTTGTREQSGSVGRQVYMDYEIFMCQMKRLREWSREKVTASVWRYACGSWKQTWWEKQT